jgi:hypothetical protein
MLHDPYSPSSEEQSDIGSRSTLSAPYEDYSHDPHHYTAEWNLILSCFFTIFICSWVAIRPNVPTVIKPPGPKRLHNLYNSWTLFYEKLVLVLIFLIFPEFVLGWAFVQREMANSLTKITGE